MLSRLNSWLIISLVSLAYKLVCWNYIMEILDLLKKKLVDSVIKKQKHKPNVNSSNIPLTNLNSEETCVAILKEFKCCTITLKDISQYKPKDSTKRKKSSQTFDLGSRQDFSMLQLKAQSQSTSPRKKFRSGYQKYQTQQTSTLYAYHGPLKNNSSLQMPLHIVYILMQLIRFALLIICSCLLSQ